MELPEVQTIVNDLCRTIQGLQIKHVEVVNPQCIKSHSKEEFISQIQNKVITDIQRYAKFIVWTLNDGQSLIIHLRMTGQLYYSTEDKTAFSYIGLILRFQNGGILTYCDKLRWGRWHLLNANNSIDNITSGLGPDLLRGEITESQFCEILAKSKESIHSFLLNQKHLVGIGNIYANEALFIAKIYPRCRACTINKDEKKHLFNALNKVLSDAIKYRGTTFSDYRDLFGEKGHYQQYLRVFKRSGKPCLNCRVLIQRDKLHGRSIFFCPNCQRDISG